jgi:hypothetical protein
MKTNDEIKKNRPQPFYYARILVAVLLYPLLFFLSSFFPDMNENNETITLFLMTAIPSIIIVFLIPITIRGSHEQKIIAAILLLPAAWWGFAGWQNVIYRFMDYPFGR